jgi:uncharacterized membrane protein YccC
MVSVHGYSWLLAAITADMVFLGMLDAPHAALHIAGLRTAEVVIGTASAIILAYLVGSAGAEPASVQLPGWSSLLDRHWRAVEHAAHAAFVVMAVPLAWALLDLPSLSQSAITVAAVMAVPISPDGDVHDEALINRGMHRLAGCLLGGIISLVCLALSITTFVLWLAILGGGVWLAAQLQNSKLGIGYVGTQAAVVFICMLVQGSGPPDALIPGISRLVGISGGLCMLLIASGANAIFRSYSGRPRNSWRCSNSTPKRSSR